MKVPHRDDAACADSGVDFFPKPGNYRLVQEAKDICASCPIVQQCLEYAMTDPYGIHGVWGGTTKLERIQMYRSRRRRAA
jgi:WhiB family redox-sensing transcriptional regulator